MSFTHSPNMVSPTEIYNETTLFKVYDALREDGGLTEKQTRACLNAMQNRGILFRERAPEPLALSPVPPITNESVHVENLPQREPGQVRRDLNGLMNQNFFQQ